MEISTEWILGVGGTGGAALLAGSKALWGHWTRREEQAEREHAEKTLRYKEILDAKDKLVAEERAKVEELSKKLSAKSDEHAAKIQELMGMTLGKVEDMGRSNLELFERTLRSQGALTGEIQALAKRLGKEGA